METHAHLHKHLKPHVPLHAAGKPFYAQIAPIAVCAGCDSQRARSDLLLYTVADYPFRS